MFAYQNLKQYFFWSSEDPGWTEHGISVIAEWVMTFANIIVFGTFYSDFKNIKFKKVIIDYNSENLFKRV
jgi:hypothetical protein